MTILIADHYWIIGESSAEVYQSKSNTLVSIDEAEYVAWLANNTASPIASEAELAEVISQYKLLPAWLFLAADTFIQPTPTTYTKGQLAAYAASARFDHASGGCAVAGKTYNSDVVARNTINSAYDFSQVNASQTFAWKLADGTFVTLDQAAIANLNTSVSTFVQNCFACESATVAAINGGTITDLAAIDAAFAAVSNVFP